MTRAAGARSQWVAGGLVSALARRPWLGAPVFGAVAACGFQPLGAWPLTLAGLAGLIWLVASAPGWRRAAAYGWFWGVAHFTLGNNWIATAFTYQAKMPAWLGWLAVFGLSLYLALFPALAALVARAFGRGRGGATVLAFAGAWILAEWARGWVFTGFPWNPIGVVALGPSGRPGLALLAPYFGTYALSGVVVALAGAWYLALSRRRRGVVTAALLALPLAAFALPLAITPAAEPGRVAFTLVQPGIDQSRLDDPDDFEFQFRQSAALSRAADPARPRLVLWPESGVPDYLRDGYPLDAYAWRTWAADPVLARWRLARAVGPGALLLTGATDLVIERQQLTGARNVITAIDGHGVIRGGYAKAHLVPYGEYLPMRALLEPIGIARLVPGDIDLVEGPGPRTLDFGPLGRIGMQICYEIVFSGAVVDRHDRPQAIFNPTNDGWFGAWGPPQHLAQARLRAIEEGLPVLRATMSGISAVIDANGVVRGSIARGKAARIDGFVPRAHPPTPFARLGNALALGWGAIFLVTALVANRRRRV